MENKEITCIICPIGCKIKIRFNCKKLMSFEGSRCKQGIEYAKSEAIDPKRVLTSSILVINGEWPLVSVKTTLPISKNKIFTVLNQIKQTVIEAPIKCGDIIINNVEKTGADIVATKNVNKK